MITQRQTILVELIRTAAQHPGASDEEVRELVAQKLALPVELVTEAVESETEAS